MLRLVYDIETDNLLRDVTKVHCIALYNLDTRVSMLFVDEVEQKEALALMSKASLLVGHNIKGYDEPALKKLKNWEPSNGTETYDTLIAGCILWPEEIRSLENWTKILKLKESKVQNDDWSTYTPHMGTRCLSDIVINAKVYEYIIKQKHEGLIASARVLEQEVSRVHAAQTVHGVWFNTEKAQYLYKQLDDKLAVLREEVIDSSPARCLIPGVSLIQQDPTKKRGKNMLDRGEIPSYQVPFKKDGTYTQATMKYFEYEKDPNELYTVKGPYTKVEFRYINPDSPQEIKELLLNLGWVPTEYNNKKLEDGSYITTSPKLTEDSYDTLPDGLGLLIATYNTLKHRRNFLQNKTDPDKGAIADSIRGNGSVSADAFTCGTPTARYRHSGTVCNIPRVTSIYGKELRSLFGVPEGHYQIGVDLAGIEARVLAHYLLRGNFTNARQTADLILSPDKGNDFHSFNAKVWGVSRDTAKTCLYALMYGAGAKKLARILGRNENAGAKIKQAFYKAHPAIKELNDALVSAYRSRGHLIALDGRPLYCRGENKLLNQLLQNAAAIIFKMWMVSCDDKRASFKAKYSGIEVDQMIAYHDEVQFDVKAHENVAEEWGSIVCETAREIGRLMNILVPIDAEYKIGKTWEDCH